MTTRIQWTKGGSLFALGMALALCSIGSPAHAQEAVSLDIAAPELVGGPWLNTSRRAPIKLVSRRGKVTLVEFWTFG